MLIALIAVSVLAVAAIIGSLTDRRAIGRRAERAESERDVKALELSRSQERLSRASQDLADSRKDVAKARAELESSRTRPPMKLAVPTMLIKPGVAPRLS